MRSTDQTGRGCRVDVHDDADYSQRAKKLHQKCIICLFVGEKMRDMPARCEAGVRIDSANPVLNKAPAFGPASGAGMLSLGVCHHHMSILWQ